MWACPKCHVDVPTGERCFKCFMKEGASMRACFCGCCGNETDGGDWCRKCRSHVAKTGTMYERTFYAQNGRECPYQVGLAERPQLTEVK